MQPRTTHREHHFAGCVAYALARLVSGLGGA
jgi:hypothetical protein